MDHVAAVEELQQQIRQRLIDAAVHVDPPADHDGSWWIDVEREGRTASVEWRPAEGFGVARPGGGYGEGVDFVTRDAAAAADHIVRLLAEPVAAAARRR